MYLFSRDILSTFEVMKRSASSAGFILFLWLVEPYTINKPQVIKFATGIKLS